MDLRSAPTSVWVFGTAAVLVISLASLGGALMIPIFRRNKKAENRFFHVFVGLAVATLASDALLHMVPEVLEIHSHDDHGHHGHDHAVAAKQRKPLHQNFSHEEGHDHSGHDHNHHEHHEGPDDHVHHGHEEPHSHEHEQGDVVAKDEPTDQTVPVTEAGNTTEASVVEAEGEAQDHDHHGHNHERRRRRNADDHEDHDHSHEGHDHGSHEMSVDAEKSHAAEEAKYRKALVHMSVILFSLWLFYMLESISTCYAEARDLKAIEAGPSPYAAVASLDSSATRGAHIPDNAVAMTDLPVRPEAGKRGSSSDSASSLGGRLRKETIVCFGLRPIALMILVGDAVHNFADGLAISASMSNGVCKGLSTALAILCHELPHELGDFVVLLDSGLSVGKALLLNFLSALTAFAGFWIGIPIAAIEGAKPWLLALAAGMFLYVALVDMMHHLREMEREDHWWLCLLYQNIGLFAGYAIILLIALFEDNIRHIEFCGVF